MPGRRLKPEQVQRLCGIEQTICQLVLESLVDAKFLYQTRDCKDITLLATQQNDSLLTSFVVNEPIVVLAIERTLLLCGEQPPDQAGDGLFLSGGNFPAAGCCYSLHHVIVRGAGATTLDVCLVQYR
jgi:hypothetical protein